MVFKLIILSALLVAVAQAGIISHNYHHLDHHHDHHDRHDHEELYHHPEYKFKYSVTDHHTGDIKSQDESRNGDSVHGSYSLVEADGSKRIVHYTADDKNGFKATVEHVGGHSHHQPIHSYHHQPESHAHSYSHYEPLSSYSHYH